MGSQQSSVSAPLISVPSPQNQVDPEPRRATSSILTNHADARVPASGTSSNPSNNVSAPNTSSPDSILNSDEANVNHAVPNSVTIPFVPTGDAPSSSVRPPSPPSEVERKELDPNPGSSLTVSSTPKSQAHPDATSRFPIRQTPPPWTHIQAQASLTRIHSSGGPAWSPFLERPLLDVQTDDAHDRLGQYSSLAPTADVPHTPPSVSVSGRNYGHDVPQTHPYVNGNSEPRPRLLSGMLQSGMLVPPPDDVTSPCSSDMLASAHAHYYLRPPWRPKSTNVKQQRIDTDSPEAVDRKLRALLNKLTRERFESISDKVIVCVNHSEDERDGRALNEVVRLVFEVAVRDTRWAEMYARLCRKMMEQVRPAVQDESIKNAEGSLITGGRLFRQYLANLCQEIFEHVSCAKGCAVAHSKIDLARGTTSYTPQAALGTSQLNVGLTKFVGELYKLEMVTGRTIHDCIKAVLGNVDNPKAEENESLYKLLDIAGQFDTPKAHPLMDVYFGRMKELVQSQSVNTRVQSMSLDLIELCERKWISRPTASLTTLSAVHAQTMSPGDIAANDNNRQRTPSKPHSSSKPVGQHGVHQVSRRSFSVARNVTLPASSKAGDLFNLSEIGKLGTVPHRPTSVSAKNGSRPAPKSLSSSSDMFPKLMESPELAVRTAPATPTWLAPRKPTADLGSAGNLTPLPRSSPKPIKIKTSVDSTSKKSEADLVDGERVGPLPISEDAKRGLDDYAQRTPSLATSKPSLSPSSVSTVSLSPSSGVVHGFCDRLGDDDVSAFRSYANGWDVKVPLSPASPSSRFPSLPLSNASLTECLPPMTTTPTEVLQPKLSALLSKLDPEQLNPISDTLVAFANQSQTEHAVDRLKQVIRLVLDAAIDKPMSSALYARLCLKIMEQISIQVQGKDGSWPQAESDPAAGSQLFCMCLLKQCRDSFEHEWAAPQIPSTATETGRDDFERTAFDSRAKRRGLGVIRFISEIFRLQLLPERIMHDCVKKLLANAEDPEDEDIECLCEVFAAVGRLLDKPGVFAHMNSYFTRMARLADDPKVSLRGQGMLRNVITLRQDMWVPRDQPELDISSPTVSPALQREGVGMAAGESTVHQVPSTKITSDGGSECISSDRSGSEAGNAACPPTPTLPWRERSSLKYRPPIVRTDLLSKPTIGAPIKKKGAQEHALLWRSGKLFKPVENAAFARTRTDAAVEKIWQKRSDVASADVVAPETQSCSAKRSSSPRPPPKTAGVLKSEKSSDEKAHEDYGASSSMNKEQIKTQLSANAKEFFALRNLGNGEAYLRQLPLQHRWRLVNKLVSSAVASGIADARLVGDLLSCAISKDLVSSDTIEAGFSPTLEVLDVVASRAPNASSLIAIMLKGVQLDKARLSKLIHQAVGSDREMLVSLLL